MKKGSFHIGASLLSELVFCRASKGDVTEGAGGCPEQAVCDLTHREAPWRDARSEVSEYNSQSPVISLASMGEYYSSITEND